ncbi:nucleoside hydrolase [Cryobacterium sinapicolor]|uniref:Nucleoside hydrolase n=2 Tax=Cryobacterium sinapicolor TaxID=1259236 RepID=A0ABY2IZN2_9MICO|nr:nucleoside hydrolase [Cryobacterium sinapicolor]
MAPRRRPIYLDCDTGIDDAVALSFLLATAGIRLVGVGTVNGCVNPAVAAANTLSLLATAGRDDIPVAVGAWEPVSGISRRGAAHMHGRNGIGDVLLPRPRRRPVDDSATELLIRLAHEYPGELEIIAVGPLTNLAEALCLDPELPRLVRRVTIMGGSAFAPGNAGKYAEGNIAADPTAAADVFAASWPVTLIPLDATAPHTFDETHRRALAASSGLTQQALAAMLGTCLTQCGKQSSTRRFALHNSLAAAFATGALEAERAPTLRVRVDMSAGPRHGQTHFAKVEGATAGVPAGQNPHEARVVLTLRRNSAALLLESILTLAPAPAFGVVPASRLAPALASAAASAPANARARARRQAEPAPAPV